jgi:hypothetical protein
MNQKLRILSFVILTLLLIGWLLLLWISLHLSSFPCEEAHPGYSCNQSALIEFAEQASVYTITWVGLIFLIFRKWR